MCRDRRRHYDDGFMRVVADLIRGGAGRRSLARRLGVPVSTAGKWVLSYRFGGEAALMGEREGNRRYDYETKLAAVRDHIAASLDGTDREAHASSKRRCSSSGNVPAIAWVLRMPARPIASARSSRPSHLNNGRRSDAACRIDDSDQRERSPARNPSTCEPSEPSNDTTP